MYTTNLIESNKVLIITTLQPVIQFDILPDAIIETTPEDSREVVSLMYKKLQLDRLVKVVSMTLLFELRQRGTVVAKYAEDSSLIDTDFYFGPQRQPDKAWTTIAGPRARPFIKEWKATGKIISDITSVMQEDDIV
jgi:hypothetical protein